MTHRHRRHRKVDELRAIHAKGYRQKSRFPFRRVTLLNPVKLTEAKIRGGKVLKYNVREYDPDRYDPKRPTRTGVRHLTTLRRKEDVKRFLKEKRSGLFSSQVESSQIPRTYIQAVILMPDGSVKRRNLPPDQFLAAS